MRWLPAALVALAAAAASGQEPQAIVIERLPTSLAGDWLFRTGHDPAWASPFRERRNWHRIEVPGAWERHGYPGYNGHAWYRLSLFIPSQLAPEALGVDLGMIGDTDEVFLNGRRVGATGSPPPTFDKATLARRFYPLPRDAVRFGEHNELAIHVYNGARFGGLLGPPPTIDRWERLLRRQVLRDLLAYSLATLLGTLALLHLAQFLAQRDALEHLSFAGFLMATGAYLLTYTSWGPTQLIGHSATFRLNVVALLAGVATFPPALFRIAHRPFPTAIVAAQTFLALGAAFAIVWRDPAGLYFWVYVGEAAIVAIGIVVMATLGSLPRRSYPWGRWLVAVTGLLFALAIADILVDVGVLPRATVTVGELHAPFGLVPFATLFSLALSYSWVERRWGEPLDFATGLISRERFLARLREELARGLRSGAPAAVALLRVEAAERAIDRDQLRLQSAEVLRRALRQIDLLARYDRDTIALLLAETEERAAIATLQRLRHLVADTLQSADGRLRTTAGVAQYRHTRHTGPEELLAEAEAALYAALSEGGDCTTAAP